jgi:hypothetical protein
MKYVGLDWAHRRAQWCALSPGGQVAGEARRGRSRAAAAPSREGRACKGVRDDGVAPVVEPDLVRPVWSWDEHIPGVQVVVVDAPAPRGGGQALAPRSVGLARRHDLAEDIAVTAIPPGEGNLYRRHGFVEALRHDLRAHVGAEGQGRVGLGREVALQVGVAAEDYGQGIHEIGFVEAITEGRPAVRQQQPAAPGVDSDRREGAVRDRRAQELVERGHERRSGARGLEPDTPMRCRRREYRRPRPQGAAARPGLCASSRRRAAGRRARMWPARATKQLPRRRYSSLPGRRRSRSRLRFGDPSGGFHIRRRRDDRARQGRHMEAIMSASCAFSASSAARASGSLSRTGPATPQAQGCTPKPG